jgi:hypothetical protein
MVCIGVFAHKLLVSVDVWKVIQDLQCQSRLSYIHPTVRGGFGHLRRGPKLDRIHY